MGETSISKKYESAMLIAQMLFEGSGVKNGYLSHWKERDVYDYLNGHGITWDDDTSKWGYASSLDTLEFSKKNSKYSLIVIIILMLISFITILVLSRFHHPLLPLTALRHSWYTHTS